MPARVVHGTIGSMAAPSTGVPKAPATAPTHGCVRCGRPVPLDVAMCEYCNPLGLSEPASTQVHGTAILAVGLAIVVLAVLGRVALSGIGPFRASVDEVVTTGARLTITLSVTNEGSKRGGTTCRISRAGGAAGAVEIVQTPAIQAGETATFTTTTERFGSDPVSLAVGCDTP
jgi:hypothetical protein